MRTSTDDIFTTIKNKSTLDEQIELYKKNNSTVNTPTEEVSQKNKPIIDSEKFFDLLENQFNKIDEKISTESFFKYAKTPGEITDFSKHLISCIKKINPQEEMILFYFLQTAICYSVKFTKEEECNLEELIFLAIMLGDDTTKEEIEDSVFDIIIKDDLIKKSDDNSLLTLRLYYERFCKNRTENTPKIILKNLIKIAKNYRPYQQWKERNIWSTFQKIYSLKKRRIK